MHEMKKQRRAKRIRNNNPKSFRDRQAKEFVLNPSGWFNDSGMSQTHLRKWSHRFGIPYGCHCEDCNRGRFLKAKVAKLDAEDQISNFQFGYDGYDEDELWSSYNYDDCDFLTMRDLIVDTVTFVYQECLKDGVSSMSFFSTFLDRLYYQGINLADRKVFQIVIEAYRAL